MDDPGTLQQFHAALDDERIAAVSVAWEEWISRLSHSISLRFKKLSYVLGQFTPTALAC